MPSVSIPWYRRVLGDEPVVTLGLPDTLSRELVQRIQAAFPETDITYEPPETHFVSQLAELADVTPRGAVRRVKGFRSNAPH